MNLRSIQDLINSDDSIIGVATNTDKVSALAIVRISGPIGPEFFNPVLSIETSKLKPRYQYFCQIKRNDEVLDEILFTYFKGPNSFTGENSYELSLHGNPLSVRRIIDYLKEELHLRPAEAGEFTMRALRNKKLDVAQVEGLDNFLHAQSVSGLNSSMALLNGGIHRQYLDLQQAYVKLKMAIDLNTDFAEDIGEVESEKMFYLALSTFDRIITNLMNKVVVNKDVLKTPTVCLIGSVNAGKSTLFNSILKDSRSIVSQEKGTTRDYVSEMVSTGADYYKLIDTAGIRETVNNVEAEGIKRSFQILKDSFYKVLVLNPLDVQLPNEVLETCFDLVVLTHADQMNESIEALKIDIKCRKYVLLDQICGLGVGPIEPRSPELGERNLTSKIDGPIGPSTESGPIEPNALSGPIGPRSPDLGERNLTSKVDGPIGPSTKCGPIEPISLSQVNLSKLKKKLTDKYKAVDQIIANDIEDSIKTDAIFVSRQIESIKIIYKMSREINELCACNIDVGLAAQLINDLDSEISQLIGIYTPEEVLNNIFSNFCIGK